MLTTYQAASTAFLFVPALAAQAVPGCGLQPLALSGTAAPGTTLQFDRFRAPVGVGDNAVPTMDSAGNVAFLAFLGDGNPATTAVEHGVFRATPTGLALVARSGQPAPATGSSFLGLPGLVDARPEVAAGTVAFGAVLTDGRFGVFREAPGGPLSPAALQGQHLPGMPPGAQLFQMAFGMRASGVLLNANWSGTGLPSLAHEGIWRVGASSQVVVIGGTPAPGTTAAFGVGAGVVGPVDRWTASPNGRVAFTGYLDGANVDDENDEGIWLESGVGTLQLLVREGTAVQGVQGKKWGSSTGVLAFGSVNETIAPSINDAGDVLFGGAIHGGSVSRANVTFVRRGGSLQHVATGVSIPSGNAQGDPAPGYGGRTFARFLAGSINASGAFSLLATVASGNVLQDDVALYRDVGTGLDLVAGEGLPLATMPGCVATLVRSVALGEDGRVLYSAEFSGGGVTPANDVALILAEPSGDQRLLLREGDIVDVEGTSRALREFAVAIGIGADDRLAVELFFTDGSEGVFLLDPEPTLIASARVLPLAGGRVDLGIDYGVSAAGRGYAVLATQSGLGPTTVSGVTLPIVPDWLTVIALGGSPMFPGFLATLDSAGRASAAFDSVGPLPPVTSGLTVHFAAVLIEPLAAPSPPVSVTISP